MYIYCHARSLAGTRSCGEVSIQGSNFFIKETNWTGGVGVISQKRVGDIRLENLQLLLNKHWDGRRNQLEIALGIGKGGVSKWFQRHNMPQHRAREIEQYLGLEPGILDKPAVSLERIYYVMVSIQGHRVRDFIEFLQPISIVKEACALFGEMDVFVKVECVEKEFQDLVLRKMQRYPSVRYTKTYQGLDGARWQKPQGRVDLEGAVDRSSDDFISRLVHNKMDLIFNDIRALDESRIMLSRSGSMAVHPKEILENVRKPVLWTSRFSRERYSNDRELLLLEKNIAANQGVEIRRIVLLDAKARKHMDRVNQRVVKECDAGLTVRLLDEVLWVSSRFNASPEGYMIADDDLVMVQKKREDFLMYGENDIREYKRNFKNNWLIAMDPDTYFGMLS